MLSPSIHETRPHLPMTAPNSHRLDRFFVLSFDRYRGSLYVVSRDEISLLDNYQALPEQPLQQFLYAMERKVFDALTHVQPLLCLAARQNLRQRYEAISRIEDITSLSLDRYFSPSEKMFLHRYIMTLIRHSKPMNS